MVMNGVATLTSQREAMLSVCGAKPATAAARPAVTSFGARARNPKM